ncbi:hypothetical protein FPZ42_07730 [Mucilaginibacter achroorhodeus]|uniref:Uncharacterized protein n=1 Tax=Mucilaginibacter achroorhodeus TaxID=2599294 RepID=A0A563U6D3_9SPHI|nr:hypothetical protein [Mucilaginibacter achroorhodeus]TWR26916.1 hypothetical protein FPZ42_07730 [Mucilaginibacter achroorhodeus]
MKINSILDEQGEILDVKTVQILTDLYNEQELQTNHKDSLLAAQDILARNINEAIDVNFLGKSVTVEVEINSEKDVFIIHPSMYAEELNYELGE